MDGVKKICPKCSQLFDCHAGNIAACDCSRLHLSDDQLHDISQTYSGCLCNDCIAGLTDEREKQD